MTLKKIFRNNRILVVIIASLLLSTYSVFSCIPTFDPSTPNYFNATQDELFSYKLNVTCENPEHLPLKFQSTAHDENVSFDSFNMSSDGLIYFTPVNNDLTKNNATYGFYIVVEDSAKDANLKYVTFHINNVNDPPNITNIYPLQNETTNISGTVKEAQTITLNATVTDPDLLTYLKDNISVYWYVNEGEDNSTINYTTTIITDTNISNISAKYTPTYTSAINGSPTLYNITLIVIDSGNLSANYTWIINVTNENREPLLSKNFSNITLFEDTLSENILNLDDFFYDLDIDDYPLSYSVVFLNGSSSNFDITITKVNDTIHNLSIRPLNNYAGNTTIIQFIANDSFNTTYSNNISLLVLPVNDPPVIQDIPDQTAFPGVLFTLQVIATDIDSPSLNYSNNHTELFMISSTGLISFTPEMSQIGNYTIEINVTDGINVSTAIFNLEIRNNTIPYVEPISDKNVTEGTYAEFNVTGVDIDDFWLNFSSNYGFLSFMRTGNKTGKFFFNATQEVIDSLFNSHTNDNVSTIVRINVTDSKNATNSTTFNLTIFNVFYNPNIQPLPDMIIRVNKSFQYDVVASDNDNYPGYQDYVFIDNTTLFDINPLSGRINFTPSFTGSEMINITVNDSSGLYNSSIFNLTIIANTPPYFTDYPTELICYKGYPCVYDVNATDLTNDIFNFSNNHTEIFIIDPYTGLINFTPNSSMIGDYIINLTVRDDELYTNITFNLSIRPANTAPYFLPPIEDYPEWLNISEDFATTIIAFAYDDENDSLNFSVAFNTNETVFNITNYNNSKNTALINFTPNATQVGSHSVNITVSDGSLNTTTMINFSVSHTNHPPAITYYNSTILDKNISFNTTIINMNETETLLIIINITDKDIPYFNDNITYLWYINNSINKTTQSSNSTSDSLIFYTDYFSAGVYNITASVVDTYNATANITFTVNVSNVNRMPVFGIFILDYQNFTTYEKNHTTVINKSLMLEKYSGNYYQNGTMLTSAINFKEDAYMAYSNFSWIADSPDRTNIIISVANSYNPINFTNYISIENNSVINLTPKKYLRINSTLLTNNSNTSPALFNITIKYQIANITINQNSVVDWIYLDNYFSDPDNDVLRYNVSGNTNITIEFNETTRRVTLMPNQDFVGTETIFFTATDEQFNITSNNISITVNESEPETNERIIYINSGGATQYVQVPVIQEKTVLEQIGEEIIAIKNITTLTNNSIIVDILINNILNKTIKSASLSAFSYNKYVNFSFDNQSFDEILNGESKSSRMIITSFKTFGSYEVTIYLNALDPVLNLSRSIIIGSIEKGEENLTQINTKMAFAKDLLISAPECLELNEHLVRAQKLYSENKEEEAAELLDNIIKDCNNLISKASLINEQPKLIRKTPAYLIISVVMIAVLTLGFIVYKLSGKHKKHKNHKSEEKNINQ